MHKHASEIIRLAKAKPGTKVWVQRKNNEEWYLTNTIDLSCKQTIICNDKWAELRKAQADGKKLEYCDVFDKWMQRKLTTEYINTTSNDIITRWRIKPKEPIYEWQWIIKLPSPYGYYEFSHKFYTDEEQVELRICGSLVMEKYEPSKRPRKG